MSNAMMLIPIFLPIICGAVLLGVKFPSDKLRNAFVMGSVLIIAGVVIWILNARTVKKKVRYYVLALLSFGWGEFGVLQSFDVLAGVPVMSLGIPAVLSIYFDVFSGFVQALVFTLLSMVYISGSTAEPAEAE